MTQRHPYHIVDQSPWPMTAAFAALFTAVGLMIWFHENSPYLVLFGLLMLILTMIQWWRDVVRESTYEGNHTSATTLGLRWGMALFMTSEVLFFFAFFWAFFHSSLAPTPELGTCWPPTGMEPLNPFQVPLLNTTVLLASGASVTWAHHGLVSKNRGETIQALTLTILLGFYFTLLQGFEYFQAPFTITDAVYGSTFFVATGFHGFHVIMGTTFLLVCLFRQLTFHFSSSHHFGFEAAAWYWHFVDVVWLFLFTTIYWWGS